MKWKSENLLFNKLKLFVGLKGAGMLILSCMLISFSFSEASNKSLYENYMEVVDFPCSINFCSSKAIDQLELIIDKNQIGRMEICHLFFLIDNRTCSKQQLATINRILFKVIEKRPIQFLNIYKLYSKELQKKIIYQLRNLKYEKDQIEKVKEILHQVGNTELEQVKKEILINLEEASNFRESKL